MGDFSGVAASQAPNANFNKSQAFAAALQRAKQIAAKINPGGANSDGGTKRPLEDGQDLMNFLEPDSKKLAAAGLIGRPNPGIVNVSGIPLGPISSEDIKVPDKMVGLIIGRGGEQITRLQSESGCKIQMAPDSGGAPDRTCTLTGNSQAIGRAKELINAIVNLRFKTEGPPTRGMEEIVNNAQPIIPNNPSFVEVMIPGPKVGLVIGKGGETIKQLQEKSGAKMVVIQDGPNQEAEKPLRITGEPHKVEHAKNLVYELLAEKEQQMNNRPFQGGRQGGGAGGGGGVPGGPPGGGNPRFNNRNSGQEESTFIVPAAKCGVVIGRGGETIKQINQATGAHCELDRRPGNNPNEKTFIIRGSPEQIESAKQMISDKLGQGGQVGGGVGAPGGAGGGPPQVIMPMGGGGMGGGPGGPGGPGGYNQQYPGWGPPAQQPQPGAPYHQPYQPHMASDPNLNQMGGGPAPGAGAGGAGGQPDYSQQWIEYYRSVGMHSEADAVEQQMKAKQQAGGGPGGLGGPQGGPGGPQGGVVPGGPGPAGGPTPTPAHNGQPDYSAQWAQYYRSIGKIKEAEMIEQQMKNKGGAVGPASGGGPGGPGMPGAGGYPGAPYQGGYPGAPAAPFYPGAPQGAPYYPGAPYPGVPYGAPQQPSQQPPPPSDQPPQQSNQPPQS